MTKSNSSWAGIVSASLSQTLKHTTTNKKYEKPKALPHSEYGQSLVPGALQSGVTAIAAGWNHTVVILGTAVSLQARFRGNELSRSWPANRVEFTLQSTASLTPPVVWRDFTTVPAVDGQQFTVPIANVGPGQFFRLKKP